MPIHECEERPGLAELILEHGHARVRLSLQGAHITEYTVGGHELLWVSQSARFARGVAIRGGIPLCWPWFGASLDDDTWPQHGFARTSRFRLVARHSDEQQASVVLALAGPAPMPEWQGAASLEVEIRLSGSLWMELRTTNTSDRDLLLGAGLHSYFAVGDWRHIAVPAVTGLTYRDKTAGFAPRIQTDPLAIDGEVDRVYLQPPRAVELIDPGASRNVAIEAWGNTDLVIWNPGPSVAAAMSDFDNDGYRRMVCIEPAIALDNRLRLAPGETTAIGQTITLVD
jgi:D-hexose-6-phosphate mutarotase